MSNKKNAWHRNDTSKPDCAPRTCSAALEAVSREREQQDKKWGIQNHAPHTWLVILMEEVGEASKATLEMDWPAYRAEMVQVAAVAVAAIEACDREMGVPPNAAPSHAEKNPKATT